MDTRPFPPFLNNDAMNTNEEISVQEPAFNSFGITGSYGDSF
jgi:hypothetical protein